MKLLSYIHIREVLLSLGVLLSLQVSGQVRDLTLQEASDLALAENWEVRKSREYLNISQGDLKESNAVFMPQLRVSENFASTTDPLMVFGFKLKQEITEASDFDPELLNNPERIQNFNTRIELSQPLLNLDGIYQRKAAQTASRIREKNHEWTEQLMVLQAKAMYFQLKLALEQRKVVNQSNKAALANALEASNLHEQGIITRSDVLAADLRATELESQLMEVENQIFRINSELAHFLNLPSGTEINPTDDVLGVVIGQEHLNSEVNPENRADIRALSLSKIASEYELKSYKNLNLPRLNLMGAYEWNDASFLGTGANNYMVGASLQWDVFTGGTRSGKVQKAKARQSLASLHYEEKLSNSQIEIQQLQNQIKLAGKQLELSTLAVEQAEESYQIISDRYKEGLEKTSDLLSAEASLLDTKLIRINTLNQYQQLAFRLEVLTESEIITQ